MPLDELPTRRKAMTESLRQIAYLAGYRTSERGEPSTENPHLPSCQSDANEGQKRKSWFDGFYTHQIDTAMANVFQRYSNVTTLHEDRLAEFADDERNERTSPLVG